MSGRPEPPQAWPAPAGEPFDDDLETRIRKGFEATYLATALPGWLQSDAGRAEVHREVVDKYQQCLGLVVPWVERNAPLAGRTVVEIGCGTGAKSAAFAGTAGRVLACDLSEPHAAAARWRVAAMGLPNVEIEVQDAGSFLHALADRLQPRSVGMCLLFAVLEHMTLEERLSALQTAWGLLEPGGVLAVLESPNRLLPWDWHSSRLPFFNMLPDDLARRYYDRSPRADFVDAVGGAEPGGDDAVKLALTRQGRGISHHEFEVALGEDFHRFLVADGWDAELMALNPAVLDELQLVDFVRREQLNVPAAFTRYWIELLLQRPGGESEDAPPSLPAPLSSGWRPDRPPATGAYDLAIPPGAGEAILVLQAGEAGGMALDDGLAWHPPMPVPAGRSVHRVALSTGAVRLRAQVAPSSHLELAFAR